MISHTTPDHKPITSAAELWKLHSVQVVSGFIYLDLQHHPGPLTNLSFLENLREITGARKYYIITNFSEPAFWSYQKSLSFYNVVSSYRDQKIIG